MLLLAKSCGLRLACACLGPDVTPMYLRRELARIDATLNELRYSFRGLLRKIRARAVRQACILLSSSACLIPRPLARITQIELKVRRSSARSHHNFTLITSVGKLENIGLTPGKGTSGKVSGLSELGSAWKPRH